MLVVFYCLCLLFVSLLDLSLVVLCYLFSVLVVFMGMGGGGVVGFFVCCCFVLCVVLLVIFAWGLCLWSVVCF